MGGEGVLVGPRRARVLGGAPQPTRAVTTVRWDDAHRELHVPAAPRERVLVVPESVSPAWRARLVADDGTALADPRAVTVDGWKQGWVLPAAATGAVRDLIRSRVEGPGTDRYLAPEIEAVVELAASGALVDAAERVAGELG